MRTVLFIIQKEFIQVFRNPSMLPIIFVVPIIQLIILVNAATFEMKNIKLGIVDLDNSSISGKLVSKFGGSPYFDVSREAAPVKDAIGKIDRGSITALIVIPPDAEKKFITGNKAIKLQVIVDAINGTNAGLIQAYILSVLQDFNIQLFSDRYGKIPESGIYVSERYWYNPVLNYKTYMVPGILVMLVTIIGFILSGMNIVREKEIGTIEQLNVTPVKKYQFIAGKLIPFWIIALFELAFGLIIGKLLFDIPVVGNVAIVFGFAGLYLIFILSLGLFVSTLANTQQQAMLLSFFFLMVFILMSGLFTSIESMPEWAQIIDKLNPLAYFIKVMRMVLLKGSGIAEISSSIISMLVLSFSMLAIAVYRYRKVT